MKKIAAIIICLTFLTQLQAQYKKASFFARKGRFYEVGGTVRFLGEGRSGGTSFFVSAGNATPGKHLHHSFDFEYMTKLKFKYTEVTATTKSEVTGFTGKALIFRYNLGYFFVNTADEDKKILPFINLNIGALFGSGSEYSSNSATTNPQQTPSAYSTAVLGGGSAGLVYKLTNTIGIRGSFNYTAVHGDGYEYENTYQVLPNHTSVSLAVRFMLQGSN